MSPDYNLPDLLQIDLSVPASCEEGDAGARDADLLNSLRVASPCDASWEEMEGDDLVRVCPLCQKNVYNLSGMNRREAAAFVREVEGRLCVRFYRRADGTLLIDDCPVGLGAVRRAVWRRAAGRVEMALGIFFVCVCYGAAYGAAFGGAIGVILGILSPLIGLGGVVYGAMVGAPLGAIGGGIFAIVGSLVGVRAGWVPAGLFGSAVVPARYWHEWMAPLGWGPFVMVVSVTSVFLGGLLGLALNQALRRGTSTFPGIQNLADLIVEWNCISERDGGEADAAEG
jgi:hypothetical protein